MKFFIVEYDADGRVKDKTLYTECRYVIKKNLKLKKNRSHFICTKIPFFGDVMM